MHGHIDMNELHNIYEARDEGQTAFHLLQSPTYRCFGGTPNVVAVEDFDKLDEEPLLPCFKGMLLMDYCDYDRHMELERFVLYYREYNAFLRRTRSEHFEPVSHETQRKIKREKQKTNIKEQTWRLSNGMTATEYEPVLPFLQSGVINTNEYRMYQCHDFPNWDKHPKSGRPYVKTLKIDIKDKKDEPAATKEMRAYIDENCQGKVYFCDHKSKHRIRSGSKTKVVVEKYDDLERLEPMVVMLNLAYS